MLPKRIYFLFPVYLVGGGETYVCRMIEYIHSYTDIKVGIIDFNDGMLTRTCKKYFPEKEIQYIDYKSSFWELDDDSIIFSGADHIACIKPNSAKNLRIHADVWESIFGWDILFEKKAKKKFAKLVKETNGFGFIDIGCYSAACKQLKQKFEFNYLPLFYYLPEYKKHDSVTSDSELNLVWLGRFAGSKLYSIYNIIQNFANYKTNRKKILHLIGNGPLEEEIRKYIEKFDKVTFVFPGVLTDEALAEYLQKYADVGVAMGTSTLNIGSLGIPVVMAHQSNKPFFRNKFLWLSDMEGGCTGTPFEEDKVFDSMYSKLKTFDSMMDDIINPDKREEIGKQGYMTYKSTYGSIEYCGKAFLDSLCKSTLTYDLLKRTLKYMPYDGSSGLAVEMYRFLGIPFLKVKHHLNKRYYYICGLRIPKFVVPPSKVNIYILGIKMFTKSCWGRYSFYESTNEKIKEECKDKYAISSKIVFEHSSK